MKYVLCWILFSIWTLKKLFSFIPYKAQLCIYFGMQHMFGTHTFSRYWYFTWSSSSFYVCNLSWKTCNVCKRRVTCRQLLNVWLHLIAHGSIIYTHITSTNFSYFVMTLAHNDKYGTLTLGMTWSGNDNLCMNEY